jgi:hypothetical protein
LRPNSFLNQPVIAKIRKNFFPNASSSPKKPSFLATATLTLADQPGELVPELYSA